MQNLDGKWLYFGSLYEGESQYKEGVFIGLALDPRHSREVKHNAYDRLNASDNSIPRIQSQDVFEHLEYERLPSVLDEIYRVLQVGGLFRLSLPDYRSPLLRRRSVYDDRGNVIADLMMGNKVVYDEASNGIKTQSLTNGWAHLWFPTHEKLLSLILSSEIRKCAAIEIHHAWIDDHEYMAKPFPEVGMRVTRCPPLDMRASGKPISIVADFTK